MHPHEVAIVVDPRFGEALRVLSDQMHVWAVESPGNRLVIDQIWSQSPGYSLDRGVTSFLPSGDTPAEQFCGIVGTVDAHHDEMSHDPPWTVLHCYGVEITAAVRQALADFGVDQIEESAGHFIARRPNPPHP